MMKTGANNNTNNNKVFENNAGIDTKVQVVPNVVAITKTTTTTKQATIDMNKNHEEEANLSNYLSILNEDDDIKSNNVKQSSNDNYYFIGEELHDYKKLPATTTASAKSMKLGCRDKKNEK